METTMERNKECLESIKKKTNVLERKRKAPKESFTKYILKNGKNEKKNIDNMK